MIKRFPDGGTGERLNHPYLLFESNFNGTWDQYIDAFSEVVPFRMKAIWGTSFGFPGPLPVEPFKGYIRRNEFVANHYFSAYPGATTTEIVSAARVEAALEDLSELRPLLDHDAFRRRYESFLTKSRATCERPPQQLRAGLRADGPDPDPRRPGKHARAAF